MIYAGFMATRRKTRTNGTRAVIYIRVSTVKQAVSGLGLDDQKERLTAYCTLRGLEVADVVTDAGESAGRALDKRPGGRKVLALVKAGKADAIVILKLDRAFRNTENALATVRQWDSAGVALHVAEMGGSSIDTSSAVGKLFLTMLAGFGEFERNLAAERTTAALASKARSGNMRLGGEAPYGWRYAGDRLVEVPREQDTIRRAKDLRAVAMSFRQTCKLMTAEGHRNRAGGAFVPVQIERMLAGSVRQMHAAGE